MQINEFESLTGIRPTLSMYNVIEREYMKADMDKTDFCRAYALNIDGIASRIQALADREEISQKQELESRIAELQAQLDKQQAWSSPKIRVLRLVQCCINNEVIEAASLFINGILFG